MSYNKSNAAYDFSRFEPVEQKKEPEKMQKIPAPKKKQVKKQSVRPATVVKWVFVSAFVMLSLASIMVGNIKITQLNDEITNSQKSLDVLKSNQVSLDAKLEARMSMQKVEDYAVNKLGLAKVQPFQIEYVHLTNQDKVVVSGGGTGISGSFKNLIHSVMEYFE
jgi:cell division protein FtsL